ncbi:enterochelin esterase [Streptomyces phaeoluteigriseus]|uniref:Enterochelin esterase n=1 Tax=Streptomyces phaeoluteigriseus TaxID=114686 RepID=A0ABY4Z8E5_9ACTN|nr:enterochelin esterase [Streptomyces phaeoluteigriseus]USQ85069.1 enterochelin esterase [Streptomyces phaeoluteigriseus]
MSARLSWTAPPEGAPHHPPRLPRPQPLPRLARPARALPGPGGTEEFWAHVRRTGTPLVGPDPQGAWDHRAVTFLWRGTPGTRAVQVLPNKLGDPRDPAGNLMERVPGTDVWHWTLRLRHDWRGTYDLYVDEGGGPEAGTPAHWQWLRTRRRSDPFNTRSLPHRWDGTPVPYAELPEAPRAVDWEPRPDVPRGTVTEHRVPGARLGRGRRVWLYQPPGDPRDLTDLPVLVLLDGEHWEPRLKVSRLLDNLIADGRVPPLAAVLPEAVDEATRWRELSCRPEYVAFLTGELLPWAADRLPLTGDPARTVIAGQSLGGLTAAYAALAAPHRFGNALVQSGSFWWPAGPDAEWLTRTLAEGPRPPVRLRLSFGEQEWVALPAARRLRDTLGGLGCHDSSYREFDGGHDYLCWRTELADGLVELLGR